MVRKLVSVFAGALALGSIGLISLPAAAQTMKIGVIDVQRIITESATGKAALSQLDAYGKEQQDKLRQKKEAVDQLQNRLAEGRLSLAEDRLAELQKELETKSIELRRAADDAQREFNRRQEEVLKGIELKVMPVIQKVGEEGGYTAIFRKFESGLVYAAEQIDITPMIIQRLDASGQGG